MANFPAKHWDSQADKWDDTVADKNFPHHFYYYEADLYITDLLKNSSLSLELGAGTCGSTINQASKNHRIVATDYSRKMLRLGREKLRNASLLDHVDLVIADVCHLPCRDNFFDTVFSRGVALSYASNPEKFAREAYRVLKAGGRLGLDFMNRTVADTVKRVICRFDRLNDQLYYVEMFNEKGRQKRIGYRLPDDMALSQQQRGGLFFGGFESRPDWLKLEGLKKEEWWAVFYTPAEARRLFRKTGFKSIKLSPLGCFTRGVKNPRIRKFLVDNRDQISEVQKEMAEIFRIDQGVHLFLTATKQWDQILGRDQKTKLVRPLLTRRQSNTVRSLSQ